MSNLKNHLIGIILLFSTWGGYFLFLWPRILFVDKDGSISSGWIGVWADWSAHFSYTSALRYRDFTDWLSVHPLYIGRKFTYPFVMDGISALLQRIGISTVDSFIVPSIVVTFLLLLVLYLLFFSQSNSVKNTLLSVTIFFTSGGLGFWWFFQDVMSNGLLSTLAFAPREYTHIGSVFLEWINVMTGEFLPQRAFLLGMPFYGLLIWMLYRWYEKRFAGVPVWKLFILGLISGFGLSIHVHSGIVFAITSAAIVVISLKNWRKTAAFILAAGISYAFVYYTLYGSQISTDSFIKWYPGWLANPHSKNINFSYFWFINWGFFTPIAFASILFKKLYKNPIILSGVVIFIISNLILFQPYDWDNSKIFTWAYLFLSLPVAIFISDLAKKNIIGKILAIILFILVTFSGFLDIWHLTRTEHLTNVMWNTSDQKIAQEFVKISNPTDRVLTADKHNHWVSSLAGRQILLGYKGWMWTYGINYDAIDHDMVTMFSGNEQSKELLNKYNIRFVVIGPAELGDYHANEKFFKDNYSIVLQNEEYRVYRI